MTKPNFNFSLSVKDVDTIERALNSELVNLTFESIEKEHKDEDLKVKIRELTEVLGKLHKQKNWYRPKNNYIGG
jgi:hypothetical protein